MFISIIIGMACVRDKSWKRRMAARLQLALVSIPRWYKDLSEFSSIFFINFSADRWLFIVRQNFCKNKMEPNILKDTIVHTYKIQARQHVEPLLHTVIFILTWKTSEARENNIGEPQFQKNIEPLNKTHVTLSAPPPPQRKAEASDNS
jgi:sugar diacid utilization regulator